MQKRNYRQGATRWLLNEASFTEEGNCPSLQLTVPLWHPSFLEAAVQRFVNSPAFGKPVSSKGTSRELEPRPHRGNNEEPSVDVPCILKKWPLVASTSTKRFYKLPSVLNWKLATRGAKRRETLLVVASMQTSYNVSTSLYLTLFGTYNNRKTSFMSQQGRSFSNFAEECSSRNLHIWRRRKGAWSTKKTFYYARNMSRVYLVSSQSRRISDDSKNLRRTLVDDKINGERLHVYAASRCCFSEDAAPGSFLNGIRLEKRIVTG